MDTVLYNRLVPGFKLLYQDGKTVARIKAKMGSTGVEFKDLPYREMEMLRQVGIIT